MAGRIAMAFLKRIEQGDELKLPSDVNRLTIDQMVDYVAKKEGYNHSQNFATRVWRPARPVIHFAAALAAIGQERRKQEHQTSLNHLLADSELLNDVIERATVFAQLIETDSHFPVKYQELVQL